MTGRDDQFRARATQLQERLAAAGVALALITDEDSVYYFSSYHGYLHMDFGRPTILAVPADGDCVIVTPDMELEMAGNMSWIADIRGWQDGLGDEWRGPLGALLRDAGAGGVGIEPHAMPPVVRHFVDGLVADGCADIEPMIATMRMIKGPEEIELARHAGKVAEAMMAAGHAAIGEGVAEYEIALATMAAGTRMAAELLETHYDDPYKFPNAHFLQIMASGTDTTMPHHRASTKRLKRAEPVFLCFCGMTNFRRFKLGFDRMFWVGEVADPRHEELYAVAVESQRAALAAIRPGVTAESVHAAYARVIQGAGHEYPFRCGRTTGYSYLERPQLIFGDRTELRPGMVMAVDGSVNVPGFFRAQVGDSILVTESGYEPLTAYSKEIADLTVD